MFALFLLLLLVTTLEGRCSLNNNLCSRKARNFKFNKGKIRDSFLFTMKKSRNALHYQPNVTSEISNIKSKNNSTVRIRQEANMNFSDKRHPFSRRSTINLKETSHKSKRKFLKRHPKLISRKRFINRNERYNFNRKKLRQMAIDEKQHAAEFHEQLHNLPTGEKVLENHFRMSNKKVTKRPIVFKLKHNKGTLSEEKTNNHKLKKRFNFDSNNNGYNMSHNENFLKNFMLRNNTTQDFKNIRNNFQLPKTSKKVPRNALDNISRVDLIFGKIPTSFYHIDRKNSVEQFDGFDIKDRNNVTSNVINMKSEPLLVEYNDKYIKRMDNVTFVTNTPMQLPVSESGADIPPKIYRSDVKEINEEKEDAPDSIKYLDKNKIKRSRSNRDEGKARRSEKNPNKRDFYTAHPAIFTLPAARMWYESDQKDYLQSKVRIHLPEMNSKEKNSHKVLSHPLLHNLKNSEVMKSKHVHHKFYHPNLQKHPSFLNATTQHGIKKLLQFLRKMIHNSKTETEVSTKTTLKLPVETYADANSATASAQNKEWLSGMAYSPKVDAEDKEQLSTTSYTPEVDAGDKEWLSPPKMNAKNEEWLSAIPEILEATNNVTNGSSYVTLEYQRNVEVIVTPIKSKNTNYMAALLGLFGLIFIIIVCFVTFKTALDYKRECKKPFSGYSTANEKIKRWLNNGREVVPTEENIDACDPLCMCDPFTEENRELKRVVNKVLGEMEFYSNPELKQMYSTKEHSKKLENAMSGIIKSCD